MKLSWSEAESKAQDRAEYRRRPVLRQELKGKEEEGGDVFQSWRWATLDSKLRGWNEKKVEYHLHKGDG